MEYQHIPVMLNEVIKYLNPRPGQNFIDCTLGGGGYTAEIVKRISPGGKALAIDLDEMAINNAAIKFKTEIKNKSVILAHDNFKNLQAIVEKYFTEGAKFDGIVFDLGLSSAQLQDRSRGFSFNLADSPLSMSFAGGGGLTAEEIINNSGVADLTKIFREYGEEKFAFKIAAAIIRERQKEKILTAGRLAEIISGAIPAKFKNIKIHPATKVFQALRIAVNSELENIAQALPRAVELLKPGGRVAVVSYHSLEDRIVKQYFRQEAKDCLCPPALPVCRCGHRARLKILTKGVLRPSEEEALKNPRARSAKTRVAEKI